ncbi:MAG: PD40 domain-containing protein [Fidelibacterota bacterium]|nr:MAG: PD40 domain-containing protein [Candidatus Neomarinimicrobiota bacterium]
MEWFNYVKIKVTLIGIVAVIILSSGNVKADFTFGEPVNLGPTINTAAHECFSTISSDGLELYFFDLFFLWPGGLGGSDIWVTRRSSVSEPWGEPVNLGPAINSEYDDMKPSISADGLTLYFGSNRPGGYGGLDLWMSARATVTDDWGAPVNLGELVNSEADEAFCCVSADGLEVYFNEFGVPRPGGCGDADLWVTKRATTDDPWAEPENLGETVNSPYYDSSPYLSPDGRLLFFHAVRPGGLSQEDMWVSTRATTSDAWGPAMPLPVPPNSRYQSGLPGISADGFTFYFCSFLPGGSGMGDTWQAPIMPVVDFNGDEIADLHDLVMLIEAWGTSETRYDIGPMPWGDGIVDEADLNVLISHWGQEAHYLARRASLPIPLDFSDVEQGRFLSWWPGSEASEHDVYVGMDPIAVENANASDTTGVYRGRQQASEYTLPEDVLPGQTYYWRIDEWNANAALTRGELWRFSVGDYLFVDDMELGDDPHWLIWWDGWGDPNNGSEVWYAEGNIVHGGAHSMHVIYDNRTAPISQIQRVWDTPQDWTRKGVQNLSLWIHGGPDNTAEPMRIILGDSADNLAVVEHTDPALLMSDTWQQWSIPLVDFTGLNPSEITSMAIVIGDDATEEGGTGLVYIDDIYLHPVSM